MARFNAPQTSYFPFHITSRTPNRVLFPIPLEKLWLIFSEELFWVHKKYNLQILSFVLMPNHFHLLARTEEVPIGKILNDLMRDTSKRMNFESSRTNQNWGESAFRTEVKDMDYFLNVYRYIYQNPLRAGLSEAVEAYPYSTLHGLLGQSYLFIPMMEDSTLFDGEIVNTLNWLNERQDPDSVAMIRSALKFKELKIPKDRYKGHSLLKAETGPWLNTYY